MGKNRIVKSLGRCIGNVALHKILVKHTNKSESKNHLESEVIEYGFNAFEKAQIFSWNENDKIKIKEFAIKRIRNLIKNYPDVSFNDKLIEKIINEIMSDLML